MKFLVGIGNDFVAALQALFVGVESALGWRAFLCYVLMAAILLRFRFGFDHLNYRQRDSDKPRPTPVAAPAAPAIIRSIFPSEILLSRGNWVDIAHLVLVGLWLATLNAIFGYSDDKSSVFFFEHSKALTARVFGASEHPVVVNGVFADTAFSLLFFLAFDFGHYVAHYLQHRVGFLWAFHKVHHSAVNLSPFTTYRVHVVDGLIATVMQTMFAACLGGFYVHFFATSPKMLILNGYNVFLIVFTVMNLYAHSNIWWSWGKLERYIVSPAMHHLHHSADPRHYNKNLAAIFTYDSWFGTFFPTTKEPPNDFRMGLGADDLDWERASLWQYFIHPIREALRIATGRRPASPPSTCDDPARPAA